jgi:hypothetical protein
MIRIRREQREKRKAEEATERARLLALGTPEAKRELEELEKKKKWCADDLCHVVSERTIINRADDEKKKQQEVEQKVLATLSEDEQAELKMQKVFEKEDILKEYAKIVDLQDVQEWLRMHSQLITEESASWMLLHMLALEMDGKSYEMEVATRNYLMIRNILDLAQNARSPPGQVLVPFFLQIKAKEKLVELDEETKTFAAKIKARAIEKKKEIAEEEAAEAAEADARANEATSSSHT